MAEIVGYSLLAFVLGTILYTLTLPDKNQIKHDKG